MLKKSKERLWWLVLCLSISACFVLPVNAAAENEDAFWDGFRLGGYSSVQIDVPRKSTAQLTQNQISLILTWDNESRFKFFSELELEHPWTWTSHQGLTTSDANFDLERFYLDYNLSEQTNIRLGRFLTPAGRWNLLHAAPLVWTSSRPIVTQTFFPTGINGVMAFGNVPFKNSALEYQVYSELKKDHIKDGDETIYKHVNGARVLWNNIFGYAENNAGLNYVGLNMMTYQKDISSSPRYRVAGIEFLTEFNRLELTGEAYYRWSNQRADGDSGAYLQSAYALGKDWYWLTRLETMQNEDTGKQDRWLIGATKRFKPTQLLKLEWVGGSGDLPEAPRGFLASFAVLF